MPELPEVETMCRGVAGTIGSKICNVERVGGGLKPIRVEPPPARFRRRVAARRIADVGRLGKRVVLYLDGGDAIVFEPRMTGLVLLGDAPDRKHLRLRLQLSGRKARQLWYWDRRGLGSVRLLSPRQLNQQLGPEKLGPDALWVSAKALRERLHESRRAIKVALLDQRAVSGIGNLYASEILYAAKVHPGFRCDELTVGQWSRLRAAIVRVLNRAIRHEGSTLADGTYRNVLNQPGRFQRQHRVYGRAGQRCAGCGEAEIRRIVQAQRSSFFCPICQPRRTTP
jgi:formamidopyrimidine-DNA glycosylase